MTRPGNPVTYKDIPCWACEDGRVTVPAQSHSTLPLRDGRGKVLVLCDLCRKQPIKVQRLWHFMEMALIEREYEGKRK